MPIESDVLAELLAMECAALDRWGNGDPSGFLEISAPDVVYFDPFREQRVDGIQELTELYESFRGQVQLQSYEIINPKVQLLPRDGVLREADLQLLQPGQKRQNYPLELHRSLPQEGGGLGDHPDPLVVHQSAGIEWIVIKSHPFERSLH
jgi:hypothetical protein